MAAFLVIMVWCLSTLTDILAESSVPSDLKQSFVHCFENTAKNVLDFKMKKAISVGKCIYICKHRGFHFAGAYPDKSCYCGNELKIDKDEMEHPEADCNIEECSINELCLGVGRFAVFKTGQEFTFHRKKRSYADAQKTCEDRGTPLAKFDTYLEMKGVIKMITDGPNWDPEENVWIGLYRRKTGKRQWGNLYWTDGTKPAFVNTIFWDQEESDDDRCFALNSENAYWIERKCTDSLMFVCEQGEVKPNHCNNIDCQNGGHCISNNDGFVCKCTTHYYGKYCEDERPCYYERPLGRGCNPAKLDESKLERVQKENITEKECINKCMNSQNVNGVECWAAAHLPGLPDCWLFYSHSPKYCVENEGPFNGVTLFIKNCSKADHCHNNPCKNGGQCVNEKEDYKCECTAGFSGKSCQDVDHCQNNPCKNGGHCVNEKEDYECECTAGFIGKSCQDGKSRQP